MYVYVCDGLDGEETKRTQGEFVVFSLLANLLLLPIRIHSITELFDDYVVE